MDFEELDVASGMELALLGDVGSEIRSRVTSHHRVQPWLLLGFLHFCVGE